MKRFLSVLLALAAVFPLSVSSGSAPDAQAQYVDARLSAGQDAGFALASTTAGTPLILVKYIGTSPAGGTVTVAAGGDITLETGTVASSTADLTVECPVSGALGGIIDVSDAACNTLGEVVDSINGSANWRAVIVAGLRTDSSDNTLAALSETSASVANGVVLFADTTVSLNASGLIAPPEASNDINFYVSPDPGHKLNLNPFNQSGAYLWRANCTFTGTGADTFKVYSVLPQNRTGSYSASAFSASGSETVTLLYQEPGGGTTVNKSFDFSRFGFGLRNGEKLLLRCDAATTFTAVVFSGGGRFVGAR